MDDPVVMSRFGYDSEICGLSRGQLMHGAMDALASLLSQERQFKGGPAKLACAFAPAVRYLDDGSGIEVGLHPKWSFFEVREKTAPVGLLAKCAAVLSMSDIDPSEAAREAGFKALEKVAVDFDHAMQVWWDSQPAMSDGLLAS